MDYPKIPPIADLIVDDQFDLATDLGVALVKLPNDHPAVIAVRLALEMRDAPRLEGEDSRAVAAGVRARRARRSSSRSLDELGR